MYDVIIVGAGPAGLSAALILGRCRRRVLVCDAGKPRNAVSHGLHGFLTRDGIEPGELLRIAREELKPYSSVEFRNVEITEARPIKNGFEVTQSDGVRLTCRKLLLATGLIDELPKIPGLEAFYGRSVFHCPYCDGWELRDQPLAIYAAGGHGPGLALELTLWSDDLVLCTDGSSVPTKKLQRLARHGVKVRAEPIACLEGKDGALERVVFKNGPPLPRRALFFRAWQFQHSDLAKKLGCTFNEDGEVETGQFETTIVSGLYVAGNASRSTLDMSIVAAAEGTEAAFAINEALLKADLK